MLWSQVQRLQLLDVLPKQIGKRVELLVDVGANKVVRGVRLLAERVPDEVVKQRHDRYKEYAGASKAAQPAGVGNGEVDDRRDQRAE